MSEPTDDERTAINEAYEQGYAAAKSGTDAVITRERERLLTIIEGLTEALKSRR